MIKLFISKKMYFIGVLVTLLFFLVNNLKLGLGQSYFGILFGLGVFLYTFGFLIGIVMLYFVIRFLHRQVKNLIMYMNNNYPQKEFKNYNEYIKDNILDFAMGILVGISLLYILMTVVVFPTVLDFILNN